MDKTCVALLLCFGACQPRAGINLPQTDQDATAPGAAEAGAAAGALPGESVFVVDPSDPSHLASADGASVRCADGSSAPSCPFSAFDWTATGLDRSASEFSALLSENVLLRGRAALVLGKATSLVSAVWKQTNQSYAMLQPPATNIWNVIVIEQENHTFDSYFGDRCTGSPGVTCTQGFGCCESIWGNNPRWSQVATMPFAPVELSDASNGCSDPPHGANAELAEMHLQSGVFKMDGYPAPGPTPCQSGTNRTAVVHADHGGASTYWKLATEGALADRYFQPLVGASTANDMFLARAGYVYQDNYAVPNNAKGNWCAGYHTATSSDAPNSDIGGGVFLREYTDPTIGDLLKSQGVAWAVYAEGYGFMRDVGDGQCPAGVGGYPYTWDPADNPFNFYPQFRDNPEHARDLTELGNDVDNGRLPRFALVRSLGTNSEHPAGGGLPTLLSDGQGFVQSVIDKVMASPKYAAHTLILITWDEGGGFYDHVSPPMALADGTPLGTAGTGSQAAHTTDGGAYPGTAGDAECFRCQAAPADNGQLYYGTRVPLIAVGRFARTAGISHTAMEHSSIVKFLEWNFLGKRSGQLGTRDKHVNNIGSMLTRDLSVIGAAVPVGVLDE